MNINRKLNFFRRGLLFVALLVTGTSCFNNVYLIPIPLGGGNSIHLEEVTLYGDEPVSCLSALTCGIVGPGGGPKVLMIPITGVIGESSTIGDSGTNPAQIKRILELAEQDSNIKGILLKINSPGGTVTDSDLIYNMLSRFKKKNKINILTHVDSLAASGGYYVAMASSHINASPTAYVGSIGVILSAFNLTGLMEKLGLEQIRIVTGKNKDTLTPFRQMRPDERDRLKSQINSAYDRFLNIILESRGKLITEAKLRKVADGRVFTVGEAMEHKLIDSELYLDDYIKEVGKKLGLTNMRIVAYLPEGTEASNLYDVRRGSNRPIVKNGNLQEVLLNLILNRPTGLYYLWQAGIL